MISMTTVEILINTLYNLYYGAYIVLTTLIVTLLFCPIPKDWWDHYMDVLSDKVYHVIFEVHNE